jgi:hypothetical protein
MVYYRENTDFTKYGTHGYACYKPKTVRGRTFFIQKKLKYFTITLNLQRLFISPKILEHMTWYLSHDAMDGVMMYPSNSKAWK